MSTTAKWKIHENGKMTRHERLVERIFGVQANRQIPAYELIDSVDYVLMS